MVKRSMEAQEQILDDTNRNHSEMLYLSDRNHLEVVQMFTSTLRACTDVVREFVNKMWKCKFLIDQILIFTEIDKSYLESHKNNFLTLLRFVYNKTLNLNRYWTIFTCNCICYNKFRDLWNKQRDTELYTFAFYSKRATGRWGFVCIWKLSGNSD